MSTIIASNVSDGTLSIPTTYVTNGSAKAWVNFNGTGTIAARDSFNVASLTDRGTGLYSVNFTNSSANTGHAPVASTEAGGGSGNQGPYIGDLFTTKIDLVVLDNGGSFVDPVVVITSTHGDLA
jgi:hypothetical protein